MFILSVPLVGVSFIRGYTPTQSVPSSVWRINVDPPPESAVTFGTAGDGRWWDQVDLTKLILAGNTLQELSEEIRHLPALAVLDVCVCVCVCGV